MLTILQGTPTEFALRQALALQERFAGVDIATARDLGLPYQEETVTARLLLGLAIDARSRATIRTLAYSSPAEGRTGADWLWGFRGVAGGISALLVQAKLLTTRPHHNYAVGQLAAERVRDATGKPDLTQREVLLALAKRFRVPAAYAFYNDIESATDYTVPCPWEPVVGPLGGVALLGADLAGALATAVARGAAPTHVSASHLRSVAKPMSCALLCDRTHTATPRPRPLDRVVWDALNSDAAAYGVHAGDEPSGEARNVLEHSSRQLAPRTEPPTQATCSRGTTYQESCWCRRRTQLVKRPTSTAEERAPAQSPPWGSFTTYPRVVPQRRHDQEGRR